VLVQSTLWGNLILGPTARDSYLPEVMAETDEDIMTYILTKCRQLVPGFDAKEVFHSFWGSRAKSTRGDWIIEPSHMDPHFIHAAGIDSPGLAGSPAIAVEIVRLLGVAGLELVKNKSFNPLRAPIIRPKSGWKGIRAGPVGKFTDPSENVVCKCEKVTEAEVVEAIHRSLPIDSTQAIRKRTRAGMGDCQGKADNYDCECRVARIIARETNLPIEAVGRRPWPATSTLPKRWLDEDDKRAVENLSK
jgi:glycerol-3-phosphate dehydrogenase